MPVVRAALRVALLAVPIVRAALVEAAPIERAAALLVLQGPQMSEAVQAHQKAAPADQVDQVDQVGQVVRLAAEAAGYSYLFRPWLPLPIGEIFLPQRRPTLLALSKAAKQPFNNELPFLYSQLSHKGITNMSKKP